MDPKTALTDSRALVADPDHWGRFAYAQDKNGKIVCYKSKEAVRFCTMGALYRVTGSAMAAGSVEGSAARLLRGAFKELYGTENIADFQDCSDCTHDKVLAAFDLAISRA